MIETRQLTKRYGDLTAVDNISFKGGDRSGPWFPRAERRRQVDDDEDDRRLPRAEFRQRQRLRFDVGAQALEAKRVVGYLPEGAPSYGEMTPRQFLGFIADMRGLTGARRTQRIDDVIERLHLNGVLEQPIETLSKGFKRRVGWPRPSSTIQPCSFSTSRPMASIRTRSTRCAR
jgi:ABC-2 type transport system ATP-binding protein